MTTTLSSGSKLAVKVGGIFIDFGGLVSLSIPESTRQQVDATTLNSVNNEYVCGRLTVGTLKIEGFWDNGNQTHAAVRESMMSGSPLDFLITLPTLPQTNVQFTALPASFVIGGEADSLITFSAELQVNGGQSWNALVSVLLVGDSWTFRPLDFVYYEQFFVAPYLNVDNQAIQGTPLHSRGNTSPHAMITTGTSSISARIAGDLAANPAASVCVIGGGTNDFGSNYFRGPLPKSSQLLEAMIYCIDQVLAAGKIPIVANSGAFGLTGADLTQQQLYNTLLSTYCTTAGIKYMDLYELSNAAADSRGGVEGAIWDAYKGDGVHLNIAGCTAYAALVEAAIAAPNLAVTAAQTVIRTRPNAHLMTAVEMKRIHGMVDAMGSEWDNITDFLYLGQSDTAGNAATGLKGLIEATYTGAPTSSDVGMVFTAAQNILTGKNSTELYTNSFAGVGHRYSAYTNTVGVRNWPWGNATASALNQYFGYSEATDGGTTLFSVDTTHFSLTPRTLASDIGQVMESIAISSGATSTLQVFENGVPIATGVGVDYVTHTVTDITINGAYFFGVAGMAVSTWQVWYVLSAVGNPVIRAAAIEAAFAGDFD